MNRIVQGISSTISVQITDGGNLVDPDGELVDVEVTADDGTILVGLTPATRDSVGVYTYTLTPTDTADLNWLTARWTGVLDGFSQTFATEIEIVGAHHFSIADALADEDLAAKDPGDIAAARAYAEQSLEDACGIAFVPRYHSETQSSVNPGHLELQWRKIRAVRSVTLNGTTYTTPELDAVTVYSNRILVGLTVPTTWGNYTVRYEHGLDRPPLPVSKASLMLAKDLLINGPVDDRATSLTTGDGTFAMVTPGMRGALFALPTVNAVVRQYGYAPVV